MDITVQSFHDDQESSKHINSHNVKCVGKSNYNNIKSKYMKGASIEPLLDSSEINITTNYKSTDIAQLKQKYESKIKNEKHAIDYNKLNITLDKVDKNGSKKLGAIKKKKRRLRVNRKSDPEVNKISTLLHCGLSIESPEKILINSEQNEVQNTEVNNIENKENVRKVDIETQEIEKDLLEKVSNIEVANMKKDKQVKKGDNIQKEVVQQETSQTSDEIDKKNVFQFMMDSRHRSIGTNSPGRDRTDDKTDPSSQSVQKEKLRGRKLLLQDWAEKRGGGKRKVEEEAKDKYIEHKLDKRAKRMKKMLSLKSSQDEDNTDILRKPIRKSKVIIESDDSNGSSMEVMEASVEVKNNIVKSSPIPEDVIISPRSKSTGSNETKENSTNDDVILSPSLKRTSLLHYFDVTPNKSSPSNIQSSKNIKKETNNSSIIKIKLNFTPKKSKRTESVVEENISVSSKSKEIKKKRRHSLSLRKNKENDETLENDNIQENTTTKLPLSLKKTKNSNKGMLDNKNIDNTNKVAEPLKINEEKHMEHSGKNNQKLNCKENKTPSSKWKMKLKLVDKEEEKEVMDEEQNSSNGVSQDIEVDDVVISDDNEVISDVDVVVEDDMIIEDDEIFPLKLKDSKQKNVTVKNNLKIAPLFLMSRKSDVLAANEAKKKFLHSGVPIKMKNVLKKQSVNITTDIANVEYFPQISHVQQRDDFDIELWDLPNTSLILPELEDLPPILTLTSLRLGSITSCVKPPILPYTRTITHCPPTILPNLKYLVKQLKKLHPEYPVYKVFRQLREKCGVRFKTDIKELKTDNPVSKEINSKSVKRKRGRPKKKKEIIDDSSDIINLDDSVTLSPDCVTLSANVSMWTEKYKPQHCEEIVGNNAIIQELQIWLQSWVEYSKEQRSNQKKRKCFNSNSSSDDFCSDSDTRDTDILPQNTTILVGPHGCGKSTAVYALCNQLSINVIEINASSKRPGKKILSELQEATKSHQVKNTDTNSVNSFFQKLNTDKQENANEDDNKKLTLLLVEDADIVFDDHDEGFINALVTLITSSKRPIIITSSDDNCAHLQKLMTQHKVLVFSPLSNKQLGPWLQLLCMVEGVRADGEHLSQLLDWNCGDIRRTLLQLQFWVLSGGDPIQAKRNINDEGSTQSSSNRRLSTEIDVSYVDDRSNLSWMCNEESQLMSELETNQIHSTCIDSFISYYKKDSSSFQIPFPINLGNIWWNIPTICRINAPTLNVISDSKMNSQIKCPKKESDGIESPVLFSTQGTENAEMNEVNNDKESVHMKANRLMELKVLGDVFDSLAIADVAYTKLEVESEEPYHDYWRIRPINSLSLNENKCTYRNADDITLELTHWLVENNVKRYGGLLDVGQPRYDEIRWRNRQRRYLERLGELVPACSQTDRGTVCADYLPALRDMCRSERLRGTDTGKRNNRFYHYLRSLGTQLSEGDTKAACSAFNMS